MMTLFFCSITFAQTTISGSIKNNKNEPFPGVSVAVIGDTVGTITAEDGTFRLSTERQLPVTIEVTMEGSDSQKIKITSKDQDVNVVLNTKETQLDEIVVSASRAPEKIRDSPVTIERMTIKDIKKSASPTFYDGLENLKEVQMNTSSMSFKSINTRGFATVANTRFLQLVDGMDNSSPLLNFVLGNLIGVSEIDVQSVELLPGASSALYGANAFNGILFMNSKSPFTYEGVSAYGKIGLTSQIAAGNNLYYDFGVRIAKKFSPNFAAKVNLTYMQGTDWHATNYDDLTVPGRTRAHHGYNGVNVYGDEAVLNLKTRNAFGSPAYNLLPNEDITRTGYNETDLTESEVKNAKIDFSLHYRPFANDLEVIVQSKFGFGNSIYQGASRYNLNGFFMQQHKLEFKGKNFFLRGYTTTEDGGKSYDMTFTALNINRIWKSDAQWFGEYGAAFGAATLGQVPGVRNTPAEAHAYARRTADVGRLIPGTQAFRDAFNKVIGDPDVLTGSKLVDNSRIYHSDVNYNFKDIFKPAEIQVGGSYRAFRLNSGGRIYTDANDPIKYNEYGIYTQVQKKLFSDKLKLTGSVRFDKAQNFDGNFSPRVSFVYSADEKKNHNFRGSFQTGFRNPATQDQYIGFNIGSRVLIGSAPDNLTRFTEILPISVAGGGGTATLNGENAYFNSFTEASYKKFDALYRSGPPSGLANAATLLEKASASLVQPEEVQAFDLGYRGNIGGYSIDLNGYYNVYNNFIGGYNVIAPYYGSAVTNPDVATNTSASALANRDFRIYQVYTNTSLQIKSIGLGLGLAKKVYKNFEISANYNYAQFDFDQAKDPSFEASFNTPKHRIKGSISNDQIFENWGFNVSARWNDEYLWQSPFADGIIDSATVLDAQVSYGIPRFKSIIKIGATNLFGKEYTQVLGAGAIGQQYFIALTFNP